MSERHPSIVNQEDLDWSEGPPHGDRFASRYRSLGRAAGGDRLQCTLYEVQPGKRAFPMHYHYDIEEAYYILSGTGLLRLGTEEHPVGPGDYVATPGGPDHAHQLINTGTEPLRYLCLSTANGTADVCVYPDSGKVLASARWGQPTGFRGLYMAEEQVGYFDGE